MGSYLTGVSSAVRAHTRAVICRGFEIAPSSRALADAVFEWTMQHQPGIGDMSLQLLAHGEDLASEWDSRPFVVGIFLREVYGLNDDHRLGLDEAELKRRITQADQRLDGLEASLRAVVVAHAATLSPRKLLFVWSGPLCSATLVKGAWQDEFDEALEYFNVAEGEPGIYTARQGASQDAAAGGVLGFALHSGSYDDNEPPVELTTELMASKDPVLKANNIDAKLYVFPHYD